MNATGPANRTPATTHTEKHAHKMKSRRFKGNLLDVSTTSLIPPFSPSIPFAAFILSIKKKKRTIVTSHLVPFSKENFFPNA